jgi:hypothetical protein
MRIAYVELLNLGGIRMKKFTVVFLVLVFMLGLYITSRYNHLGNDTYGYLQVYVRSGDNGNNPPVKDVRIKVKETGAESITDSKGYSTSIRLKLNEIDTILGNKIGYYTILVTKPGSHSYEYQNVPVRAGTFSSPYEFDVFIVSGAETPILV